MTAIATRGILIIGRSGLLNLKRKAIFLLYRVLQALALPVFLLYLLSRGLRNRHYIPTLWERFGELPASWQKTAPGAIWLHAVSVGEVLAAVSLIEHISKSCPRAPVFVSTTTLAGRAMAEWRLARNVAGVFYAPFDFAWAVRRVLRRLRPSVLVIVETEIWPNLFREARRVGCGLIVVNGRISDRALPRYLRYAPLFTHVLSLCDRILVQSPEMRHRYVAAGAPESIVEVGGNLKYDFAPAAAEPDSPAMTFIAAGQGRPLWIAASTCSDGLLDEEDFVLAARRRLPEWRLILAPRQPERFDAVARKLEASGLAFTRRSSLTEPAADILLLDTIGELSGLFAHADVVFMGGTLADKGGHNILEPALFGKPIVVGPHMENFRDIATLFEERRAVLRIASGDQLADAVLKASRDPELGPRALEAAATQRGAATRAGEAVTRLHESMYPCERIMQPAWMFLWFFAELWRFFSARDRRAKRKRARGLPVPVISVGNITAGGTGKTPTTIELLRDLQALRPGLLTRGHGRSTGDIVLLPRGDERLPVSLTGDEAQLYLRGAAIPTGIGADRYETGRRLLGIASVGLFLLDDGFQHRQLHRDFDLVLIDALRPFGGGHLLPLGLLREPLEGLARASAFLITRSGEAVNLKAIETVLRQWNPHAPIYHARTVTRCWTNESREIVEVEGMAGVPSVAFCGLGNPHAFWCSLDRLKVNTLERHDYGDHHRYTPSEVRRLARHAADMGAEVLLTTAKDAVNLCPEFESIVHPLRLWWLEIGIEIDRRDKLIAHIAQAVRK